MKVVDFISKISEDINIKVVTNGYLLEISGRDVEDNWTTVKLVCLSRKELDSLLSQCFDIPHDS